MTTTHVRIVPKLRMSGAIALSPIRLYGVDRVSYNLHVGYFNSSVNVCSVERNRRRPCMCVGKELVMSSDDSEKGVDSLSCAAQPYYRTDSFRSAEISVTTRE
jgi:hypothetical protein